MNQWMGLLVACVGGASAALVCGMIGYHRAEAEQEVMALAARSAHGVERAKANEWHRGPENNYVFAYAEMGHIFTFMEIAHSHREAWTDQFVEGTIRIDINRIPPWLADDVMTVVAARGGGKYPVRPPCPEPVEDPASQ